MASCSTQDEAQTFQVSCRQLFSHLRRRASAGPLRPDAEKAGSQRPQATLVTQPKIAARAKMARATQQNARSGSAGTVSQSAQDWRQIGGSARAGHQPALITVSRRAAELACGRIADSAPLRIMPGEW
jgi:hypothetical protein